MTPALRTAGSRLALASLSAVLGALALTGCSSSNVDCAGTTCTVTLTGDDASADILGNSLAFAGTQDGRATLSLGDQSVSCAQGESVSVGPLSITCSTVTDDSVQLTASVG